MRPPWSLIPAVPVAAGMACGILLARAPSGAIVAVAALAAAFAGVCMWRRWRFAAPLGPALLAGLAIAMLAAPREAPKAPAAAAIVDTVYASPLSGDAAAFVATTVVADGSMLRDALRDDFKASGLAHVLALSGFHVGIVAMLALVLTQPLLLTPRLRPLRALLVLAAVWAFAWLGGMSASLVRAAVMCSLLIASRLAGRYNSPWNSLAVAAVVILAWHPDALYDVGFQLSFAAVAGILAFSGVFNPFDRRTQPGPYLLASAVAVPVAATLATAPIVAAVFGTVPLLFLPANIIVGVLFGPFYALSLLLIALVALGLPCGWLAAVVDGLYSLMADVAAAFAVSARVDATPAALITAVAALLLLRLYLAYRRSPHPAAT